MTNRDAKIMTNRDAKSWAIMPDWFVGFTTGGGSVGQVESRGLLKMGRGGIKFSRPVFFVPQRQLLKVTC